MALRVPPTDVFTSTKDGLVPAPRTIAGKVLRDDATWITPGGAQGPAGPPGPAGPAGPMGPPGPAGGIAEAPADGKFYSRFNNSWAVSTGDGTAGGAAFGHNILDFGADPTGARDSVGAIEAAMQAATSRGNSSYGLIFLPLGHYKLSRSINGDLSGTNDTAVRFVGEAVSGRDGAYFGSTLQCDTDFAYRRIAPDGSYNQAAFEHLTFLGHSGIKAYDDTGGNPVTGNTSGSGLVVRHCRFNVDHRGILASAMDMRLDNLYFNNSNVNRLSDPEAIAIGLWGGGLTSIHNVHIRNFNIGVVVVDNLFFSAFDIEQCNQAIVLGQDPITGSQANIICQMFRIGEGSLEANGQGIVMVNVQVGTVENVRALGHQIVDTTQQCESAIHVKNAQMVTIQSCFLKQNYTDAAFVVENGTYAQCLISCCRFEGAIPTEPGVNYPAGTTTFKLAHSTFNTALPKWMANGLVVEETNNHALPAGAKVVSFNASAFTVTLDRASTATINTSQFQFYDSTGTNKKGGINMLAHPTAFAVQFSDVGA